jgi:hypothetical protein
MSSQQVNFDHNLHVYTDSAGKQFPSVTTLLAHGGIVNFDAIREEIRERSLKRGTSVHWITELSDLGALKPRSAPKALRGYLKAWRSWRENSGFTPLLIEKPFISPYGYAGTPDRFGSFPNGTWGVVDLKSGEGAILPAARLQLAAYSSWFSLSTAKTGIRRIAIKLHSDGTYAVAEYPISSYQIDFATFFSCLEGWKKDHRD